MKTKILTVLIMLVVCFSVFKVSADVTDNNNVNKTLGEVNVVEIRVAIHDDNLDINNDNESGGGKFLIFPLRDYEWRVGNYLYCFKIDVLTTKDILNEKLNASNYDVFINSWAQVDYYMLYTGFSNLPKNKIRVREIKKFIENGGGYYGSCGGSTIAGNMINEPDTLFERVVKKSCLGISCFNVELHTGKILSIIRQEISPSLGHHAYIEYSGYGLGPTNSYSGVPTDCNVSKDNPIFDDLIGKIRRINWIGAPALIPPENPDREIMVLARYPDIEFSDNETLKINHWVYTGGLRNLIKAFINPPDLPYWKNVLGRLMGAWVFAIDWDKTDEIVETNLANKPFMTAEIYPNLNQSRIVRCSGHPEFSVIWGGHIENLEDTDENSQYEGFYRWVNTTPPELTIEDEKTYNYCIIRRIIAWASKKVPNNNLPPIYGPSQVSDIYPYEQYSSFDIVGNVEEADGIVSLDLFYRYSTDNETWNPNWTFYATDNDCSDGWSWNFKAPYDSGYYEFYSKRNVRYEHEWLNETTPPGADAIAYINNT